MKTIQSISPTIRRITYCVVALLLVAFSLPPVALAEDITPVEEPAPTLTEETPPPVEPAEPVVEAPSTTTEPTTTAPTQGPQSPPGAESDSYTYNETTGLWENSKYTWDPATQQTSPKATPTYSYNPETGHWDTTEWVYDAPTGTYVPNIISVLSLPEESVVEETSPASSEASELLSARSLTETSNTGPDSSNNIEDNSKTTGLFDLFYNAFISNNINSSAISGDALVNMNTLAGSALSGDTKAIATIFNLLQSTWNLGLIGNAFTSFTQSIFGDFFGDLVLNPGQTNTLGIAATPADITVNATGNATIDNTITLGAVSGDSTISQNTQAGDATTGSATAIANIINAINSSIAAGSSFVGMLNIYGSLNGDILLPADFISSLLASNAVGNLDTSNISNAEVLGNFNNNSTITNTVNADATSGGATVDKNTSAGNATTGDAGTNVTLLNLTGRQVIGENAMLVFVNVLGKWVGTIVDAPTGATSALLGNGITSDSTLTLDATNNHSINNTINASATSGDALVSQNTAAGDATSGDAHTAVNILNMSSSQFALTDWFGILFINVFDTWTGSFGIDTEAGELLTGSSHTVAQTPTPPVTPNDVRAFRFVASNDGTYVLEESNQGIAALTQAQVLSETTPESDEDGQTSPAPKQDWLLTIIGVGVAASLLGTERVLSRREPRN